MLDVGFFPIRDSVNSVKKEFICNILSVQLLSLAVAMTHLL